MDKLLKPETLENIANAAEKRSEKNKLYRLCFLMVSSPLFNILITVLICVNTYMLASYTFDQSEAQEAFKSQADYFFVTAFSIELLLKLIGLGFREFSNDSFNKFDTFVVAVSCLEIVLS